MYSQSRSSRNKRKLLRKLQDSHEFNASPPPQRNGMLPSLVSQSLPSGHSSLPLGSKSFTAESVLRNITNNYTKEEQDMFFALINYCYDLKNQLEDLRKDYTLALQTIKATNPSRGHLISRNATSEDRVRRQVSGDVREGDLSAVVEKIELKLSRIQDLFADTDPMTLRHAAAAKIQSYHRMRSVRKKYMRYQRLLSVWRRTKCQMVVDLTLELIDRLNKQRHAVAVFRMRHHSKVLLKFFRGWKGVTSISAPRRREALKVVEIKAKLKSRDLLVKSFEYLKLTCLVRARRERIIQERRKLRDDIRSKLSEELKAKGESGFVSLPMLEKALHQRIINDYHQQQRMVVKQNVLNVFNDLVFEKRKKEKSARVFRFRNSVGRAFYAWSDWVYMVGIGLDRTRWNAARRYEVRYNQKKVDYYSKTRLLKKIFRPWKSYTMRMVRAEAMYRKQLSRFLLTIFGTWRLLSKKYRQLRIEAIDAWKGYARLILETPFRLWSQYAIISQKRHVESEFRASLHARWKQRKFLSKVLRTWRHYALYGRVDGMYSRPVLLQSLREQKMQCSRMMKIMASQTVQIEEMTTNVEFEIQKRRKLEKYLKVAEDENRKGKMALHHMQSEIQRLETVIESMAIINPNQISHLMENQTQFGFHNRSKAYGMDGTFDPFLSGDASAGFVEDKHEATEEEQIKAELDKKGALVMHTTDESHKAPPVAKVQKKSVYTSTRDKFGNGDLSDLVSKSDKDKLVRLEWLLARFFASEGENDDTSRIFAEEERSDETNAVPLMSYSSLSQHVTPESKSSLELLKSMLLFLQDGHTSGLNIRDRRQWTKTLLWKAAKEHNVTLEVAKPPTTDVEADPLHLDVPTWRTSLSALHSMAATSLDSESTIFNRVIEMRDNIKNITNRHANKFERRVQIEENLAEGINDTAHDEPNVYAMNIKGMLDIGDAETKNRTLSDGSDKEELDDEDSDS